MKIAVRPAAPFDAGAMAALLNAIIAEGSTTAIAEPVTGPMLRDRMSDPETIWHVAEIDGTIVGFQWIGPHPGPGACDIATFVTEGRHGLGIGSRLFAATRARAALRHDWINAEIRQDNTGGLAYYGSRGFERYGTRTGIVLADGRIVDKVLMRYTL